MYYKAIWKYFLDLNLYNLLFSLVISTVVGFLWGLLFFSSFGILIGFLGFHFFKKNEYFTYYNLGFTKKALLLKVWFLNLLISLFLFLIFIIIVKWIL